MFEFCVLCLCSCVSSVFVSCLWFAVVLCDMFVFPARCVCASVLYIIDVCGS